MSESLTFNVCMKRKLFTNLNPQKNLEKLIIFTTQWCLQIYFKEKTDEQRTGRNLSQTTWVIKNVFWSTQPTAKEVSSCQGWWQLITRPHLLPISWVSLPSPCLIILEVIRNETQNSITIHSFSHKHFQRAFLFGKTDQKLSLLRNTNLKKNNFKGIFLKAVILTIKEFIKSQRNVVILHRKIQERKLCLRWTFSQAMRDENEKGHFKERMCTKAQSFGIHTLFPNVGILGNPIRSVYLEWGAYGNTAWKMFALIRSLYFVLTGTHQKPCGITNHVKIRSTKYSRRLIQTEWWSIRLGWGETEASKTNWLLTIQMRETRAKIASVGRSGKYLSGEFNEPW